MGTNVRKHDFHRYYFRFSAENAEGAGAFVSGKYVPAISPELISEVEILVNTSYITMLIQILDRGNWSYR